MSGTWKSIGITVTPGVMIGTPILKMTYPRMEIDVMKLTQLEKNFTGVTVGRDIVVYFSYAVPVALFKEGEWFRTNQHYSNTTTKHLNRNIPANAKLISHAELVTKAGYTP